MVQLGSCDSYTMLAIAEHVKKALSSQDEVTFRCKHGSEVSRRGGGGSSGATAAYLVVDYNHTRL